MTTASQGWASRAPMELDLDSFLRLHGGDLFSSSSDEDESTAVERRRTVDDILNDTDSDSSSSTSSSPKPPALTSNSLSKAESGLPLEDQRPVQESAPPGAIPETLEASPIPLTSRAGSLGLLSSASLSSLGLQSSATSSSFSSRPLPPLFSSVRPNPKPGAALAAAAAASRSAPTPHAAAIKSRRAVSGSIYEALQPQEPAADLNVEKSSGSEGLDVSDISEVNQLTGNLEVDVDVGPGSVSVISRSSPEPEAVASEELRGEKISRGGDESCSFKEEAETMGQFEAKEDFVGGSSSMVFASVMANEIALEVADKLTQRDPVSTASEPVDGGTNGVEEIPESKIDNYNTVASRDSEIHGIGEESEIGCDINKLVEEKLGQLENKLVEEKLGQLENNKKAEKKAEKRLRASMKPLEWAEELEKKQASSGLHWEEGAATQPMRLEGIRRGPPAVGYLEMEIDNTITRAISSQAFKRDHGSPQVLAVHMNFVAMGTSKGTVVLVPSKYSTHSADNMDAKMSMFGSHGEKSQAPVTSMCFNQQGDLLLVGYGDGHLTVWDVPRALAAKVIMGEHSAPVVHTFFLGQVSQITRQFKAVTGDSKGLVLLHTFSVVPLLNRFSIKTQCLLDGQKTGTLLSASPLLMDVGSGIGSTSAQGNLTVSTSGLGSMVGGVVGEAGWKLFNEGSSLVEEGVVIFVTHHNALVIRLSPNVDRIEIFHKPDGVREGSMPYTAWKCAACSNHPSLDVPDKISWLVIAWDRKVQVANLVKSKMTIYKEWNLDSAAVGVAWLDDQMLVVLTLRGQLCLFAKDGNELHRTSFVVDGSGIDDSITYHTHFTNTFGNPEKAYHNSVAVRGATIYILGPTHLIVSRLLPWKERIQVLQRAGDWMGALDMAMRLYDGQAHGVLDLPRTVDAIREAIMPYLVELILLYVDEVFSYISVAFCNQIGEVGQVEGPKSTDSSGHSEIEEQYARVGGVAIEFCVHIKRTDILFDSIFSRFLAVQHGGTFLEILEPYILRDMLGCLPPEIMQALVEHYSSKGWLQRVEQCVLHMDISSLDFNQVVKLCREHGLYGALIYLFNRGLSDFRAPLEELLVVVQKSPRSDVADIGYRMLVYLKYCFQGLAFPPGHGTLPPSRLWSIRKELLQFLLEDSKSLTSEVLKSFKSSCGTCPNLCYLLWLDTEATLEVLRCAFIDEDKKSDTSLQDLPPSTVKFENGDDFENLENRNIMVQSTTDLLISVIDLESDSIGSFVADDNVEVWPSKKDLGHLLEFISFLVSCKQATISRRVLQHILKYLTSREPCCPSQKTEAYQREEQVLALLKVVPQTDWSSYMLHLCVEAQFYKACGLIHRIGGQYVAALDSYMKDFDEPIHAFAFINNMLLQLKNGEASSFRLAVISRIPQLIKISREFTFVLVIDHFTSESQQIISELHAHPQSLFLFLKTAIDVHLFGTLDISVLQPVHATDALSRGMRNTPDELEAYLDRFSNFPKFLKHNAIHITDEMTELYLELLCQYERNSVLKFLEIFDNYRLEHCLHLCQEYGVTDAAAFLLERVGDVGSALMLVMTGLKEKFGSLVAAVENLFSDITSSNFTTMEQLNEILKLNEVISVRDVLRASVGLCQRNTQRLDPQESESLWFQLLDSFSEPLRAFCRGKEVSQEQSHVGKSFGTCDIQMEEETLSKQRFSKFDKCSSTLRSVLAQFLGEIIEGMAGYVPLPAIMAKLLSDNGNQEFGDFKLTILRMLGTYGFERRILDTAKSLIEDDTFYTMSLLKKGASHAYAPQEFICCICGGSLTKESSSLGIRVFSCGHSTHLHCESEESEPSNRDPLVGCPICLPKKNPRARSKSVVLVENPTVKNYTSSSQPTQGILPVQHLNEPDIVEKPHGLQQISRFEILRNLQKAQISLQIDALPQLKLSPPAIYHEKVRKGSSALMGETSITSVKNEKPNKSWKLRELKSKGSSTRFPLKSNIFGPEKKKVR